MDEGTNECTTVETVDGAVYINCRNYRGAKRSARAWSLDGGETTTDFGWDDALVEPICQASAVRLTVAETGGVNCVLFANPASTERERLTVRMSTDECRTWPVAKCLWDVPSAYSDLVAAPDGSVVCLYERGEAHPYERLTCARFDLEWLTDAEGSPGA